MDPHAKLTRTARKLLQQVEDLAPDVQQAMLDRASYLAVRGLLREVAAKEAMLDSLGCGNLARRSRAAARMIEEIVTRTADPHAETRAHCAPPGEFCGRCGCVHQPAFY